MSAGEGSGTKKRRQFSLAEKLKIISAVQGGRKKKDVAQEYRISASTLSTFLKDKEKIQGQVAQHETDPSRKRICAATFQDVDATVYTWFADVRARKIPVSGPLLCEKAKQFAFALGVDETEFKATSGWLRSFKQRHGIVFKTVAGEGADAPYDLVENWRESKLLRVLHEYRPEDTFNADETALFYELLPQKTLCEKTDRCKGGKRSKQRLTVLLCCNAAGTEKLKPLVIGRSAKPRCFKGVRSLPADYVANKKAWMTADLFQTWLLQLEKTMRLQNRKIALLIDNCAAHNKIPVLNHVEVIFLPPNCTSVLQPLDQGIIRSLKARYRTRILQRILLNLQHNTEKPTRINVRQAIEMVTGAWWNVPADVVRNCWRSAGFTEADCTVDRCADDSESSSSATELQEAINTYSACCDAHRW